ncbi:MAG TPA: tryptophan-rich sensory protein [Candidatus Acidoferrum sp.]|nr:tryptophan-rich sensory protein [Candidatus Acidoferrum sp.]
MLSGKWPSLLVFLLLCYGVAATASLLTRPAIRTWYVALARPAWAPPNWAFPVVWTFLYACMAVAGWLIWNRPSSATRTVALLLFAAQLALNFLWSPVFFTWHRIAAGVVVIAALWLLILFFLLSVWNLHRLAALLFVPYLLWVTVAAALNFSIWHLNPVADAQQSAKITNAMALNSPLEQQASAATVAPLQGALDAEGFPSATAWQRADPIRFNCDWRGQNPDPQRETEVRLLWTPETLFLKFHARFRAISVFPDSEPSGRRDQLWDRDVAEVFLQPDPSEPSRYKEFEVSPNGMWIDLDIAPGVKINPRSALRRRVTVDHPSSAWIAELALPMKSLVDPAVAPFDPANPWRVNFFRVEGPMEPRFYSAWRPTYTAIPNFHVPDAFGYLVFRRSN